MGHHLEVPDDHVPSGPDEPVSPPPFGEFDPYAGGRPPGALTGYLLVATPRLVDPSFARRVILLLDHGEHGALGVVLNHPGGVDVEEVLPQWRILTTPPREVFVGGPVARNALIGLARLEEPDDVARRLPEGWRLLVDGSTPIGTFDLSADPADLVGEVSAVRLFSGYAGWDSGQLEAEIDEQSWYVLPAELRDPISADPEGLWRRVLKRQGGALAVVSGYPEDLTAN